MSTETSQQQHRNKAFQQHRNKWNYWIRWLSNTRRNHNNFKNHLKEENRDTDATGSIFDAIKALSDEVRGEFESDDYKKRFLKSLSKIQKLTK